MTEEEFEYEYHKFSDVFLSNLTVTKMSEESKIYTL
jgi:hypothetical protein